MNGELYIDIVSLTENGETSYGYRLDDIRNDVVGRFPHYGDAASAALTEVLRRSGIETFFRLSGEVRSA